MLGCFLVYCPKVYEEYAETLKPLFESDPSLQHIYSGSIFPACTYNLGPEAISFFHHDAKNKPNGFIALTPLGNFNPKTGGHLVLKSLGIYIEFPPGSTILLLSSVIEHANTPILPGETR